MTLLLQYVPCFDMSINIFPNLAGKFLKLALDIAYVSTNLQYKFHDDQLYTRLFFNWGNYRYTYKYVYWFLAN